ncbi:TPA: hypothetical protein ACH3X2_005989 [Trebouxia sp. C0005]
MTMAQPAWASAAALQGTLAASAQNVAACTCSSSCEKRLALATAVARQHIALGLAPQHTRALRTLPSHGVQLQEPHVAVAKQTQQMAQLLEQQSLQIQAQQDALQKLLQKRDSLGSNSTTGAKHPAQAVDASAVNASAAAAVTTADSQAVNTHPSTSLQPAAAVAPHDHRFAGKVTATATSPAERCSDILQPASAGKSGCSTGCTVVATEQQGSIPSLNTHRSHLGPAGVSVVDRQAVSLMAQPELYNALYAAVTAIVQQAGFSQSQPTQHSLNSHSSHIDLVPQQQQQQQQSVSKGMGTLDSCSDGHQQDGSTAGRSGAANGPQNVRLVGPSGSSVDETEGKATEGREGSDSEHLQAWQSQIQQAMQVLQATLQTPAEASLHSAPALGMVAPGAAAATADVVNTGAHLSTGGQASSPVTAQPAQHAQHGNAATRQDDQSIDEEASWPQVWPHTSPDAEARASHSQQLDAMPGSYHQASDGQHAQHKGDHCGRSSLQAAHVSGHGHSSDTAQQMQQDRQHDCSNVGEAQQGGQWHECGHARWQSPVESPCHHQVPEKKRQGGVQRRLYKHGPVIPIKVSGVKGVSVRRRQRPDWDDHLLSGNPKDQGGLEGAVGGFSPRPSAKELLQEALARIHHASSPRPQHAKRQRRGLAPQQLATARQLPATAVDRVPHLQHAAHGQAPPASGYSSHSHAMTGLQRTGTSENRGQQKQIPFSAAGKSSLVKQHAFGGNPTWVDRNSTSIHGPEHDAPSAQPEQDGSQAGAAAASPDFEDPHKAKTWQTLTHLQQRMLGLISAVEGQLRLSHSPDSALDSQASDHCPTAAAAGGLSQDSQLALTTADQLGIAGDEQIPISDLQLQQAKGTDGVDGAQDCSSGPGKSEDGQAAAAAVASAAAVSSAQAGGIADAEEAAGMLATTGQEREQGSLVTALVTEAPRDTQVVAAAPQVKLPAALSCGLSDSDVHRILAHRRAYIKRQRAFDRACVGNEQAAFDPTQVLPSMTLLCKCCLAQETPNCTVGLPASKAYTGNYGMQLGPSGKYTQS